MLRGEMEKNHELLRDLFNRKLHTPIAAFCADTMSTQGCGAASPQLTGKGDAGMVRSGEIGRAHV